MTRKLKLALIFSAGVLSGGFIYAGILQIFSRPDGRIGGEVLIPLMLVLLIYFGWNLGIEWNRYNLNFEKAKSYHDGFVTGVKKAHKVMDSDRLVILENRSPKRDCH